VKPIYKTETDFNIANFRPISLLTSFSKVFEKIIYSRLYQHVVQNQILVKEQYGFRNKLSTDKASYTLIHEILTALNNKQIVGGIFYDSRKAFNCVNHRILLTKLEQYGTVGKFRALIKSYLTERYQRVVIHNKYKKQLFRLGNSQIWCTTRIYSWSLVFLIIYKRFALSNL
jgi:hypothetical protein